MRIGRNSDASRTRVVVLTADAAFDASVRATFGTSSAIELAVVSGRLAEQADTLEIGEATVVVVDLDAGRADEMAALARLMTRIGTWPPVIAVTQVFDENVARTLLQMRIADFLVKPVEPIDLVRACARVAKGPGGGTEPTEAKIYTFLPAVGGAGVTTLAVQTAMILLNSGSQRAKPSTFSTSNLASMWRKSNRGRIVLTGSCSKSCCHTTRRVLPLSPRQTARRKCALLIPMS
jgi:pilus assembly protein CpaE